MPGGEHNGAKVAEVLSMAYTDSSLRHVLSTLDVKNECGDLDEHNIRTRLADDWIAKSYSALERLAPMYDSLAALGNSIDNIGLIDAEMETVLNTRIAATRVFAAEVTALQSEKSDLETKMRTVETYRNLFDLNEHERSILGDAAVTASDEEFFSVFAKAKQMYKETNILMADYPRAGEYVMAQLVRELDRGYDKLKQVLDQHINGQLSRKLPLRKYMALLADRPILFKMVLNDLVGTRRSALALEFQQFQTSVITEFEAPAVLGSLLAWVHAAIVNEFENVSILIDADIDEARHDDEDVASKSLVQLLDTTDTRRIVTEVVESITSQALESLLKQRVTSLVLQQTDPVVVDRLSGIIIFYTQLLEKYDQKTIIQSLEQLDAVVERQFAHTLFVRLESARTTKSETRVPDDKHPPEFWEGAVDTAAQVLQNHEEGVARESRGAPVLIRRRLDAILDSAYQECVKISDHDAIYLLNCLDVAKTRLAPHLSAIGKLEDFEVKIDELCQRQILREKDDMIKDSGINNGFDAAHFDLFLSQANEKLSRHVMHLASPAMASNISRGAAEAFVETYGEQKSCPRAVEDVRTLLL